MASWRSTVTRVAIVAVVDLVCLWCATQWVASHLDYQAALGMPLVDAKAQFRRPARFGDTLTIETVLKRWGNRSFELAHTVRVGDAVAVDGRETRIWGVSDPADPEGLKAGVIPAEVKALMPTEMP